MGHIYRARDANLDADVVIKVPRRVLLLEDPEFGERFSREIRSLVKLSHPHVVKVSDVGENDGLPYAVMQYLSGGSLDDRRPLDARGHTCAVAPNRLRDWLEPIADALDFIHRKGYIHRDVKPANILFDAEGNVYLSDFGIAKASIHDVADRRPTSLTQTGVVLGTPEYMSPEVTLGRPFDGRADQYGLAVMVYEMLCGRCPFQGPTVAAILLQTSTTPPPDPKSLVPSIPDNLGAAVLKGLAKEPEARYPDCRSLAEAVFGSGPGTPLPAGESPQPGAASASLPTPVLSTDELAAGDKTPSPAVETPARRREPFAPTPACDPSRRTWARHAPQDPARRRYEKHNPAGRWAAISSVWRRAGIRVGYMGRSGRGR